MSYPLFSFRKTADGKIVLVPDEKGPWLLLLPEAIAPQRL